jgi:hypothetical protein
MVKYKPGIFSFRWIGQSHFLSALMSKLLNFPVNGKLNQLLQ